MARKKQLGFSLIELMIVIGIIGVLVSIAIPQYEDYIARSKVTEGMKLAAPARMAVGVITQSLGRFAGADNSSYGLPKATSISGEYVTSVTMGTEGRVIVRFNDNVGSKVNGTSLVLTPKTRSGSVVWTCAGYSSKPTPDIYLPASCR